MIKMKQIYNFFKKNKIYLKLLTIMFFVAFIFGFLLGDRFPNMIEEVINSIKEKDIGQGFFENFKFIFSHNISIALFIIIAHLLLFVPTFILIYNAFITGAIMRYFFMENGYSVFLKILPHGIFEILGIIIATTFSLKLSIKLLDLITRQENKSYVNFIKNNYQIIFLIILLFLIAAIIETILIMLI